MLLQERIERNGKQTVIVIREKFQGATNRRTSPEMRLKTSRQGSRRFQRLPFKSAIAARATLAHREAV
jgi:hypothetical protein